MIEQAKKTGNKALFWEAHLVGQQQEHCHMEQLVNLGALPAKGFKVCVFPLKIVGASAAPARVVAFVGGVSFAGRDAQRPGTARPGL